MGNHLADKDGHEPGEDGHEEGKTVNESPPAKLTTEIKGDGNECYCQNQCKKCKQEFS